MMGSMTEMKNMLKEIDLQVVYKRLAERKKKYYK